MFGLFKKKMSDVDKKMHFGIAQCASDAHYDMRGIDQELADVFMSRAGQLVKSYYVFS
jgi:hypothetical protein